MQKDCIGGVIATISLRIETMVTIDTISSSADRQTPSAAGFVPRFVIGLPALLKWLSRRLDVRRSRLALLELSDEQLKDIGLSRTDAYREGIRSWWD